MNGPWLAVAAACFVTGCAEAPQTACTFRTPDAEITLPRLPMDVVPVTLNGSTVPFILDTGAFITFLSPEAAFYLGLKRAAPTALVIEGVGGKLPAFPVDIAELRFGKGVLTDGTLLAAQLFGTPIEKFPVYGLLGSDIIANWAFDLDTAGGKLRLYKERGCIVSGPAWQGASLPIDLQNDGSTYLRLPIRIDGQPMRAILDTGSTVSVVSAQAVASLRPDLSRDQRRVDEAIGLHAVAGRRHRFADVVIGNVDIGAMRLTVTDRSVPSTDVVIGEDFLHHHRIFVSYRQHRLFLDPAPADQGAPSSH